MIKAPFSILTGKTCSQIAVKQPIKEQERISDEIVFICDDGTEYIMFHEHLCCESVGIESIVGDISDLIGTPIRFAEESSSCIRDKDNSESSSWTFYRLRSDKGSVDIRWVGSSNGYYSESVDLYKIK